MSLTIQILILLLAVSTLTGWLFAKAKEVEKPVKVMLFVLYFWGSFFVQIIVVAVLYHFKFIEL